MVTTRTLLSSILDSYFKETPSGSTSSGLTNNAYGINHRQIKGNVPYNRDLAGLTFMVRPQLNLSSQNIRNHRVFYPLLNNESKSIQRYVRCMLDPRLTTGSAKLPCPLVDDKLGFIPIISNTLLTIPGMPDIVAPMYVSKPGNFKQVNIQMDGTTEIYSSYDLDLNFRNTAGDIVIMLIYYWIKYMDKLHEGLLVRYIDYTIEKINPNTTRIYRLNLSPDRRIVTKIAATGYSLPENIPIGKFFDMDSKVTHITGVDTFSIRFKNVAAQVLDNILMIEFNKVTQIFNNDMYDDVRENTMMKIPYEMLGYFNNRGYPLIDVDTNELNWWISKENFNKVVVNFSTTLAKDISKNVLNKIKANEKALKEKTTDTTPPPIKTPPPIIRNA